MSAPVVAALIAGGVSVVVSAITALGAFRTQERRLRAEFRTEFMAEEAIRALLEHEQWQFRSFRAIKARVRGFEDDELRKLLIRAGALCFEGSGEQEFWGLRERNERRVEGR